MKLLFLLLSAIPGLAALRAGAAKVDISPAGPVLINCGFFEKTANRVLHPLHARAVALSDSRATIAIATVDSCMMPRELIDRAKRLASERTGIAEDRILIAATHAHSTPAVMACLGSRADDAYAAWLPEKIAESIAKAAASLEPARSGFASFDDWDHTHNRRWIFRPDRMRTDPFGDRTVRANMHPGYQNPDAITESGPVDPGFSILALQSIQGRPIAALANYSQHYFGTEAVSPDYQGLLAERLAERTHTPAVLFAQGTSGDQMWMDYGQPRSNATLDRYTDELVERAVTAFARIRYRTDATIEMAQTKLPLGRRVPDAGRLAWARAAIAAMSAPVPKTQAEVYAKEAILLHEDPRRELILQAIRIGDFAITAMPNEVFALTGLKLKARSPLATFNVELANGSEGYIPPPEQHRFGGYTTWPARTAALEVEAEPKIVAALLDLLEKVSGKPRRREVPAESAHARTVRASKPVAYWPLAEMDGAGLRLEGRVALAVSGVEGQASRAFYFAGGRLRVDPVQLGPKYTIEAWVWPGIEETALFGVKMKLAPRTWHYVAITPDAVPSPITVLDSIGAGFEGKIAHVAVHHRVLTATELAKHAHPRP